MIASKSLCGFRISSKDWAGVKRKRKKPISQGPNFDQTINIYLLRVIKPTA